MRSDAPKDAQPSARPHQCARRPADAAGVELVQPEFSPAANPLEVAWGFGEFLPVANDAARREASPDVPN